MSKRINLSRKGLNIMGQYFIYALSIPSFSALKVSGEWVFPKKEAIDPDLRDKVNNTIV